MEQFRVKYEKKYKIAQTMFIVFFSLSLVLIFSIFLVSDEVYKFIDKWNLVILVSVFWGLSLGYWLQCKKILNSESEFKKAYLKETDERLVMIHSKSNIWSLYTMSYLMCILSILLRNQYKMVSNILVGILFIGFIVELIGRKILSKKL